MVVFDRYDRQQLKAPLTICAIGLGFMLPMGLLMLAGGLATGVFSAQTGEVVFTGLTFVALFMIPAAYIGVFLLGLGVVLFALYFVWIVGGNLIDGISGYLRRRRLKD